ncbi:hypothetical protein [Thermococcus celer]|uniref:Uncharacterized protein n=1 Tax=Thermococcus celer Vu 13 = JCM 8558 TaxID=1293037 RepID=A0A218P3D3_THECE|nr:hypothetical protein [Thermococcus celer]ASI99433.1 hypothetical protein A3L02_07620 [Thermococcus celer Vu 13 = JCM 8558]
MRVDDVFEIVQDLRPAEIKETKRGRRVLGEGGRALLYSGSNGTKVYIVRTDRICPGDFKVVLQPEGKKEFAPTHVRLFFDLYLKRISDEEQANSIFLAFERINHGEDINKVVEDIKGITFPMELDPSDITIFYGSLLMAEQDWNYSDRGCKESKLDPPREFLMRFIRWIAQSEYGDIDRIITTAVRNRPAPEKYGVSLFEL